MEVLQQELLLGLARVDGKHCPLIPRTSKILNNPIEAMLPLCPSWWPLQLPIVTIV